MRLRPLLILPLPLVFLAIPATASAQDPWPALSFTQLHSGLVDPTNLVYDPAGTRLFITEKAGRVVFFQGSTKTTFLDLTGRVRATAWEQGLLGLAFHPDYAVNRRLYVLYTRQTDGAIQLSEFTANSGGTSADPNSENVILTVTKPIYPQCNGNDGNHNGGQLAFGPDGALYVALGDGSCFNDLGFLAQHLGGPLPGNQHLLGKILRLHVTPGVAGFSVPPGNPDWGQGPDPRWAAGLRNPWRFSFDRLTGDLYIGDVGQDRWEEINHQPAGVGGRNYGWRCRQGPEVYLPTNPTNSSDTSCATRTLVDPVAAYRRTSPGGILAVTGGYVERSGGPLDGLYLYGDFGTGQIWGLRQRAGAWETCELVHSNLRPSTFGQDPLGRVILADWSRGTVVRIDAAGANLPGCFRNQIPVMLRGGAPGG